MRVEIPAYTDRWMMGDRYGVVRRIKRRDRDGELIAFVKLDISGRVIRVPIDDCEEI